MKQLVLNILEFSFKTCVKSFLVQGKQASLDILASNGYQEVVQEISELIERKVIKHELDIDFCKKILAMHGSKKVIEDHLDFLEDYNKQMENLDVKRHIRLQKPL
jgi:hypothetical protein